MDVQAGLVLTILFVPNIMTLDLREGDRRFDALMAGNPAAYNGEAVNPNNLSLYERCAALLPLCEPGRPPVRLKPYERATWQAADTL